MASDELQRLILSPTDTLLSALRVLEETGKEIVLVCTGDRHLAGTVTDGDIRRALLSGRSLDETQLGEVMQRDFALVRPEAGRTEVVDMMRARGIGQVPIIESTGRLTGIHTLHELLGAVKRRNAAVIMAGGRGTRLQPLTDSLPKPMIRVAGRPILERLVLHLVGYGIRDILISVNYLGHMVESHFGHGARFGCSIRYIREEEPLGTGGCLALLPERPEHPILVINGDLVTEADIGRLLEFHDEGRFAATVGVRHHAIEIPFGVADVDGGRLLGIREKPVERVYVNAGMYVLSPEVIDLVPAGTSFPITDLFRRCIEESYEVGAYVVDADWIDVGQPAELLRANGRT